MKAFAFMATLLLSFGAQAAEVQVAVASNFAKPMEAIAALFQAETGHEAKLAFGASGKFLAQITHGAPFEVLLSADADKPARLLEADLAVAGSDFTYALGRLALWSAQEGYVDAEGKVLKNGHFRHIALANPKLAPYGEAALQVLDKLELTRSLKERFVQGENISQTFQFVKSANAELGFVALSQITRNDQLTEGTAWIVPDNLYAPIKQNAVLLKPGEHSAAAKALLTFMRSDAAAQVIRSFGYHLPAQDTPPAATEQQVPGNNAQ